MSGLCCSVVLGGDLVKVKVAGLLAGVGSWLEDGMRGWEGIENPFIVIDYIFRLFYQNYNFIGILLAAVSKSKQYLSRNRPYFARS